MTPKSSQVIRVFRRLATAPASVVALSLAGAALTALLVLAAYVAATTDADGLARLYATPCLLLLGVVLFQLARPGEPRVPDRRSEAVTTAWILALGIGSVCVPLCVAWKIFGGPPQFEWTRYPYLDKRWLVLAYWSSLFTFLFLPLAIHAALVVARRRPRAWRDLLQAISDLGSASQEPAKTEPAPAGRRSVLLRVAAGALLATLFFGPPWNTDRSNKRIDPHETLHWSGIQAISKGYIPYLGAASTNYGPGMQLAMYGYMAGSEQFSVVGFRGFFALSLWLALVAAYVAVFSQLRLVPALCVALLMLLISPLRLWTWTGGGVLAGFWGWSNVLRVVGSLVIALGLCALAFPRRSRRSLALGAAALGMLWGLLAYYSQENLAGGLTTLALLLAALYLTGTFDLRRLLTCGLAIAAGFLVVWLPAIAFYLWHGRLGEFYYNYSIVPGRFLRGYANTDYRGALSSDDLAVAYYTLPILVTMMGVVSLYRWRPLRISPLNREQFLIAATCAAFLTVCPLGLLRADNMHFTHTLFAIPVVIAAGLFYLPQLLGHSAPRRWIVRALVLLLAANVLLPVLSSAPGRLRALARGRTKSFQTQPPVAAPTDKVTRRHGSTLASRPDMQKVLALMREIRHIVGDGRVFVQIGLPLNKVKSKIFVYAGYFYFVADLNPGPIWLERSDFVANSKQLRQFRARFQENVHQFDYVVSLVRESAEIAIFKSANPGFFVRELAGPNETVYVFGRGHER